MGDSEQIREAPIGASPSDAGQAPDQKGGEPGLGRSQRVLAISTGDPVERLVDPLPRSSSAFANAAIFGLRFLILVAASYLVIRGLVFLRVLVLPIILALFVATLLVPPANWLRRHRWPAIAATWAVFGLALLVFLAVIGVIVPTVSADLPGVRERATEGIDEVERWIASGPFGLTENQISSYIDRAREEISANASRITRGAISGVTLVGEVIAGLLLTVVLLFFFVKDGDVFARFALAVAGPGRADDLQALGTRVTNTISGYIRGVAIVGLVDAVLISIGLLVLGVPFVAPLAVITFLGAFLPLVGAFVAGALAALVALVSEGPIDALIVVAITVAVQQLEGDLLSPLVLGRAVKLHPVVVLIALTTGTVVGGIIGAFLSVPVAAVLVTIWSYYRERGKGQPPATAAQPGTEVAPGQEQAASGSSIAQARSDRS